MSRRGLLRGAGLAGASALLAACGIKGTNAGASGATAGSAAGGAGGGSTATSSAATDVSDSERTVTWSNWPEYLDVEEGNSSAHPSLVAFEKETGITVTYIEDVNDNDQYLAKVSPLLKAGQVIAADTFVVSDWMVARMKRLGYLQEIDHTAVPNIANLHPALMRDESFDPGRKVSLPWQSGFTGIAYNPKVTGKPVESVDQLLTDPKLKGKVSVLSEMSDTMGLMLLDMGYDSSDFTDAQYAAALAKLQKAVDSGQVRQFLGNDYAQGLVTGDIAACMAWTGDVVQLQADNPELEYVLPEAGSLLWSDNFVIPIGSRHKRNAQALINFYYQPDIAAAVADWVNYICPVAGAKEVLMADDPDVANNPLIFPSDDVMARAKVFMTLDAETEDRYIRDFVKLTGV